MSREKCRKITISVNAPLLYGAISSFMNKCGKPNCICSKDPNKLHGPYYRWTGIIEGRRTSRIISKKTARECEKRIMRFKKLMLKIEKMKKNSIQNAPWNNSS